MHDCSTSGTLQFFPALGGIGPHLIGVLASTGMSPFMASVGYQPLLFEFQEEEEPFMPFARVRVGLFSCFSL